jgi:hypothetical protein
VFDPGPSHTCGGKGISGLFATTERTNEKFLGKATYRLHMKLTSFSKGRTCAMPWARAIILRFFMRISLDLNPWSDKKHH